MNHKICYNISELMLKMYAANCRLFIPNTPDYWGERDKADLEDSRYNWVFNKDLALTKSS